MLLKESSSLTTTVKNTSGVTKMFPFLGRHGVTLDANAEYTFDGSPDSLLRHGSAGRRKHADFMAAVRGDLLSLVKTPAPVMFDDWNLESKSIAVRGGVLKVVSTFEASSLESSNLS